MFTSRLRLRVAAICGLWYPAAALAQSAAPGLNPEWKHAGKSRSGEAPHAMVVSANPIASEVGRDILRQGGKPGDAAGCGVGAGVPVVSALAVVHPSAGNIGGGGFMIIRTNDGKVHALDYRETAPGRASRDMYVHRRGNPTHLSITGAPGAGG